MLFGAGLLEKLVVSRAGNFSCPVLAGVVFLANINPQGVESQEDMLNALQVCLTLSHLFAAYAQIDSAG